MKRHLVSPVERLGRWDGERWVAVAPASVDARRVHVMTHGWAPGMRPTIENEDRFLCVWDPETVSPEGRRFDVWFGPLADAILADDPEAVVLAYSWIDESATQTGATRSLKSQLRTTANGQRLAVALRHALSGTDHELHLIGYSHGAKVATVAAIASDPKPRHLTILDSPDSLLPALGGALNDLGSYLRLLSPGVTIDESYAGPTEGEAFDTFVDTYASHYGEPYGTGPGLGWVVDVSLDPAAHPMEEAPSEHSYAWAWYLETARHPERGVGYAWSPLRGGAAPPHTQYRQVADAEDPLVIEEHDEIVPASVGIRLRSRVRDTVAPPHRVTSDAPRTYGMFWRRRGDLWLSVPVRWIEGPDDARLVVYGNRTERARSVKGWSPAPERLVHVPLGGARAGPMVVSAELIASDYAEIEVSPPAAVNGLILPSRAELRMWFRPLFWTTVGATLAAAILGTTRLVRRSSHGQRHT